MTFITGSIARTAQHKASVFGYPEAAFEVFRLAGATRCTDGGEIETLPPKKGALQLPIFGLCLLWPNSWR